MGRRRRVIYPRNCKRQRPPQNGARELAGLERHVTGAAGLPWRRATRRTSQGRRRLKIAARLTRRRPCLVMPTSSAKKIKTGRGLTMDEFTHLFDKIDPAGDEIIQGRHWPTRTRWAPSTGGHAHHAPQINHALHTRITEELRKAVVEIVKRTSTSRRFYQATTTATWPVRCPSSPRIPAATAAVTPQSMSSSNPPSRPTKRAKPASV